jgi:hypothetical protein
VSKINSEYQPMTYSDLGSGGIASLRDARVGRENDIGLERETGAVLVVNSGVAILSNLEPKLGDRRGSADRDAGLEELVPESRMGRGVGNTNSCSRKGMRATSTRLAVSASPKDLDSPVGSPSSIKSPKLFQACKTRMANCDLIKSYPNSTEEVEAVVRITEELDAIGLDKGGSDDLGQLDTSRNGIDHACDDGRALGVKHVE